MNAHFSSTPKTFKEVLQARNKSEGESSHALEIIKSWLHRRKSTESSVFVFSDHCAQPGFYLELLPLQSGTLLSSLYFLALNSLSLKSPEKDFFLLSFQG